MWARNANPRIIVGANLALAWLLVVLIATAVPLLQEPKYEASAQVWVDQRQGGSPMALVANQAGGGEMIKTLPPEERLQVLMLKISHAIDSRPVADEVIGRLGLQMKPAELLDKLTVEQVESTSFIVLTYEDTDPERAQRIVNTVGEVFSEFISERSTFTAKVYEEALVPDSPVSPDPLRNGLLTLVMGWMFCAAFALTIPRPLATRIASKLRGP